VAPVVDDDGVEVDIIVSSSRTVDNDGTKHASPGLKSIVRVVPAGAILGGTPGVRVGSSRLDMLAKA
jgi:hypothetical protein